MFAPNRNLIIVQLLNEPIMGITITSKKGQLYISFTANRQRKLFAVRPTVKATPAQLDVAAASVFTGNRKHDKEVNRILHRNLNWFIETVERLERLEKRKVTVTLITRLYQEEFLTEKLTTQKTFDAILRDFADYKRDVDGVCKASMEQYSRFFPKRFKSFLERYGYVHVDEIDETFIVRLKKHLLDLNYSRATYSHTTDVFKNFCKYLLKLRLISADTFFCAKETLKSKSCNNIKDFALTLVEVKELYHFRGVTRTQAFYKDVFIFNCCSGGLRFSDLKKIRVGDVDLQRKLLHVYTQKNKSYLSIPLLPLAEEIIRRYNPDIDETAEKERLLFKLGNSLNSVNRRFKLIAKRFYRIDEKGQRVYPYRVHRQEIVETANKGHKLRYRYMYDFFKSSLCRRTFISILLEQNYNFEQIRLYTGHRSYKAFSAYPKLSQKSKVETLHKAFALLG